MIFDNSWNRFRNAFPIFEIVVLKWGVSMEELFASAGSESETMFSFQNPEQK